MMEDLIRLLHEGNHSLVVANGEVCTFDGQGVSDLYSLHKKSPGFLKGASMADKVVGKAAAALMTLAGAKEVYADVISTPALNLLIDNEVHIRYGLPGRATRQTSATCHKPFQW